MEYRFGVTRSCALRKDGSASARIAAKMIAGQLLDLETEVGRVRNFPAATEGLKKG